MSNGIDKTSGSEEKYYKRIESDKHELKEPNTKMDG